MLCHRAVWRPRARFMSFDVSLHYDRSAALSTTFLRMQLDYMPPLYTICITFFLIFRWRLPFNTTAAAQTVAALFYPSFLVLYIRIVVRHFTNSSTVSVQMIFFSYSDFWMLFFISLWLLLLYTDNKLPLVYSALGAAR